MKRIALIGENSIEYINTLIDIWNNKDCAVLIDWRIPFLTQVEMMIEADVSNCYIDKEVFDKIIYDLPQNIVFIPFEKKINESKLLPKSVYDKFKSNYNHDDAVVLYSSGTTGKSKGIILSHFAINTNADAIIEYMNPTSKDCMYIVKALSHSSTLTGELLVALKAHIKLVVAPTIVPPRYILGNIHKFYVSIICLNPFLLSIIIDEIQRAEYKISSLRTIYVSGSILNYKLYEKAHDIFKNLFVYNVYGLSEAGPRVTAQRLGCYKSNTVGKAIQNVQIIIVDKQGCPVAVGRHGLIHVNTPSRFTGYISGQAIRLSLYKDFLNTGDIGYIDENNELHVVGRDDDLIIIDSHKIYPNDIEQQILKMFLVEECVVVKIEFNSYEFIGCLYSGKRKSEKEMINELRKKLPSYEIPRRYIWCNSIPRTLNGKISKEDARDKIIHALRMETENENR